jgi:diguanylate cyclase (GGDEF)-like protein
LSGAQGTGTRSVNADSERGSGSAALADALAARDRDILRECQRHYLDVAGALRADDPMWPEVSLATLSIVRWLRAEGADPDGAPSRPAGWRRDVAGLRMTAWVDLFFWWCDAVIRVLTEEAARLCVGSSVLHAAMATTVDTARAILVEQAKSCDAEVESLRRGLADRARRDPLTGLATRDWILDQLDLAIARLSRQPNGLALIVVGVDNVAALNERFGQPGSDAVLVELGSRLSADVRPGDLVARVGEDEFALLFEHLIGPSEAQRRAEGLRKSAALPLSVVGAPVEITVSAGVVTVRLPGKRSEEVLAQASQAMHSARRAGGDQVKVIEVDRGKPLVVAKRTVGHRNASTA